MERRKYTREFKLEDTEVAIPSYVRIKRIACFSEPFSEFEEVYEEGPYDFALPDG